jgi:Xaa-Pro aminopeptidase
VNVLIFGDTERSSALRHEIPVHIGDPFLYLEVNGQRAVVTNALEDERIAKAAPDVDRLLSDALGGDELAAAGLTYSEIEQELCVRAAAKLQIREAIVPPEFPLAVAERLREAGVSLTPEEEVFAERRRYKTAAEMEGIRRAAGAAVAGLAEAAAVLREAKVRDRELWLEGERLTAEAVRARIREVCARAGAPAPADMLVTPMGPEPSLGHDPGSGPLLADTPIVIDLWPRDEQSGCYADMTRTFVRGEISDQIAALHELVLEVHEKSCAAAKPGITGAQVNDVACDLFEAAGHPTLRTKPPGETLREGFYHDLGHGVGLDVHEAPALGRTGSEQLIAGDVIAVEPGTVVRGLGGTRVEDLLVVAEDGGERLTGAFPYWLVP